MNDILDDGNIKIFRNAQTALIFGIVSLAVILLTCCLGILGAIIGLATGVIGYIMANKELKEAVLKGHDPTTYEDYSNLNLGKIFCLVGIVLNALILVFYIIIILIYGAAILSNPELLLN